MPNDLNGPQGGRLPCKGAGRSTSRQPFCLLCQHDSRDGNLGAHIIHRRAVSTVPDVRQLCQGKALKTLLSANKRLNTAYVLKESFGQLWSYEREGWARRFFENWRASLKWQRLKPYEKFAEMIDRHWDGIAAYCRLENKVSLGFVSAHSASQSTSLIAANYGFSASIASRDCQSRAKPAPRTRLAGRYSGGAR